MTDNWNYSTKAIEITLQNHFNFEACIFMITSALRFHFIAHLKIFTTIINITVRCNQNQSSFTIYSLCLNECKMSNAYITFFQYLATYLKKIIYMFVKILCGCIICSINALLEYPNIVSAKQQCSTLVCNANAKCKSLNAMKYATDYCCTNCLNATILHVFTSLNFLSRTALEILFFWYIYNILFLLMSTEHYLK